jgi:pilus assembly protein CpaB
VDVLVTGRLPEDDGSITRTILQDILVISAGQTIEPDARGKAINAPVVTLLVTPAEAEALTLASDWRIQLVLRNGGDRAVEKTPGSRVGMLFGRAESPRRAQAQALRQGAATLLVPPPPRTTEEIVVIRGTQKTVEQVGVRIP